MLNIKVLGTGCANCKTTLKLIEEAARARGVAFQLDKVEEIRDIMGYGVMSTPGVVIDGKVVHAGGVPSRDKIEQWLAGAG
ncbi:thioredoxin family protein [Sulfuritalea sp.]|uniref:thioredoxin family protein n=1 Tax=Sulfuritalea sp. TaxID=2480090 RepID=UPI00286D8804|nr:thioredoxin family protein [Sulfuritalea sp.]